jgi:hypothetical protein
MYTQVKYFLILVAMVAFTFAATAQIPYYTKNDKPLKLTKTQNIAALWYGHITDSSNLDYVIKISSVPFNWDGDSIISSRDQLATRLISCYRNPIIIDTIFNSADSFKRFFIKSPQATYELIEIHYWPPYNLRTNIIMIAVDAKKEEVIGFYWLGNFKTHRVPPVK